MRSRFLVLVILALAACQKKEAPPAPAPAPPPQITEGLQTPESVLYDPEQDVYFISNINGQPLAVDDNGYISKVDAHTLAVNLKWVDGATPEVTLNAPKGMALIGKTLYVADISSVRKFDRKSGAPKGEIPIPDATFLNDVATDGKDIYVTDSGLKAGAGADFEQSHTDAVWKITGMTPEKIASGEDLKRPNGIDWIDGKLWVVTFGTNELYQIENGARTNITTLPKGTLDGLTHLADGSFLVSSWDAKAVYRGKPGGEWKAVVENVNSPADIGYDSRRRRLLVPHFTDNVVTMHPLQ